MTSDEDEDEDDWPANEATMTECHRCGEEKLCMHIRDPYMAEVHPETKTRAAYWCWTCYERRADEI